MDVRTRRFTLSDYAGLLWQRRLLIAALVVVATLIGLITAPAEPPSLYEATVDLRFQSLPSATDEAGGTSPVPPTEVEAARSAEVATQTAEKLDIAGGGSALLSRLESDAVENTSVLRLTLTGDVPEVEQWLQTYAENYVEVRTDQEERTAELAVEDLSSQISVLRARLDRLQGAGSTVAEARYDAVRSLYLQLVAERERTRLESELPGGPVRLLGDATVQRLDALPTSPLRPFVAPVVGLLLGSALALLIGVWRPRVGGRRRAEDVLGYPVLAEMARSRWRGQGRDLSDGQGEGVRVLRSKLQLLGRDQRWRGIIAVTSPQWCDRAGVAGELARSFAAADRRTLWLSNDLSRGRRRPRSPGTNGTGRMGERLSVAGLSEVPGVGEGASPEALDGALRELDDAYDVVIFELPPVTTSVDALVVCCRSDAVVLVLEPGRTQEAHAVEAVSVLDRYEAPLAGLVLSDTRAVPGAGRAAPDGRATRATRSPAPGRDAALQDEEPLDSEREVFAGGPGGDGPHSPRRG